MPLAVRNAAPSVPLIPLKKRRACADFRAASIVISGCPTKTRASVWAGTKMPSR